MTIFLGFFSPKLVREPTPAKPASAAEELGFE
jgi:hypothetical protein